MRLFFVAVCLLIATPALAALPPIFERLREIQAVAEYAQEYAGNRLIDSVRFVSHDVYEVRAAGCVIKAELRNDPSAHGGLGPRQFVVSVREAVGCD